MARKSEYGAWHRPPFSTGRRAVPRTMTMALAPPREGAGDWRPPTSLIKGYGRRRSAAGIFQRPDWDPFMDDHRSEDRTLPDVWVPRANGAAVSRPYVWRAPGWEARAARFGLDLGELARFDAEIDAEFRARVKSRN